MLERNLRWDVFKKRLVRDVLVTKQLRLDLTRGR
jgi:hypothetical protein